MEQRFFTCYQISRKIQLEKVSLFFLFPYNNKNVIRLEAGSVSRILNYSVSDKAIFLYSFGCIAFYNLNQEEIFRSLSYLESILGKFNYTLMAKYHQWHVVQESDNMNLSPLERGEEFYCKDTIIEAASFVLAESTALFEMEHRLDMLVDGSERLIHKLRKGKLLFQLKEIAKIYSKIIQFDFRLVNDFEIMAINQPRLGSIEQKKVFGKLNEHYNIGIRRDRIRSKLNDMQELLSTYTNISTHYKFGVGDKLIVIFMTLFPLSYLVKRWIDPQQIRESFEHIVDSIIKALF